MFRLVVMREISGLDLRSTAAVIGKSPRGSRSRVIGRHTGCWLLASGFWFLPCLNHTSNTRPLTMDLPDHVLLEAIVLAEQVHTWPTLQEQTRSTDAAAGKEKTSGAAAALHLVHPSRHRLAALEEQLGGVGSWPHWAQELATRSVRTATRSEAFKLQLFLLANGAPPLLVAEYCKSAGLLHDRKACDNLCQLLRDVRWGRLKPPYFH